MGSAGHLRWRHGTKLIAYEISGIGFQCIHGDDSWIFFGNDILGCVPFSLFFVFGICFYCPRRRQQGEHHSHNHGPSLHPLEIRNWILLLPNNLWQKEDDSTMARKFLGSGRVGSHRVFLTNTTPQDILLLGMIVGALVCATFTTIFHTISRVRTGQFTEYGSGSYMWTRLLYSYKCVSWMDDWQRSWHLLLRIREIVVDVIGGEKFERTAISKDFVDAIKYLSTSFQMAAVSFRLGEISGL